MVKSSVDSQVSVGMLEVIGHAFIVGGLVLFMPCWSEVGGILDERHSDSFRSKVSYPALVGIDIWVAKSMEEDRQWEM